MDRIDPNFEKKFKAAFIASLKLGFNVNEIKSRLRERNYPEGIVNDLILELEPDIRKFKQIKRKQEVKFIERKAKQEVKQIKQETISLKKRFINSTEEAIEDIDQRIIDFKRKVKGKKIKTDLPSKKISKK